MIISPIKRKGETDFIPVSLYGGFRKRGRSIGMYVKDVKKVLVCYKHHTIKEDKLRKVWVVIGDVVNDELPFEFFGGIEAVKQWIDDKILEQEFLEVYPELETQAVGIDYNTISRGGEY